MKEIVPLGYDFSTHCLSFSVNGCPAKEHPHSYRHDLFNFLFGGSFQLFDFLVRQLLDFIFSFFDDILGNIAVLCFLFQEIIPITTNISDSDLALFRFLIDNLDELLAAVFGQLRMAIRIRLPSFIGTRPRSDCRMAFRYLSKDPCPMAGQRADELPVQSQKRPE